MPPPIELQSGQHFGKWIVLGVGSRAGQDRYWLCRCDCGTEREVNGRDLRSGASKSCGKCNLLGELYLSPEYRAWASMKTRCDNPNDPSYERYGGRGITYHPTWADFQIFYRGMAPRLPGKSLDRVDKDGPYSKANCIWVTRRQQQNNQRNNFRIAHNGETLTLTLWCQRLDLDYIVVWMRLRELKWSVEKALTTPTSKPFKGTK
jgi:hypothetical protein